MVQAICDHRGIFLGYELGWPGSVSDVVVLKQSEVWINRGKYFEQDEYILADKGINLSYLCMFHLCE